MSPTEFVEAYERSRLSLMRAIDQAGGVGAAVLANTAIPLQELLALLVSNHIVLIASYQPPPPPRTFAPVPDSQPPVDNNSIPAGLSDGEGNAND